MILPSRTPLGVNLATSVGSHSVLLIRSWYIVSIPFPQMVIRQDLNLKDILQHRPRHEQLLLSCWVGNPHKGLWIPQSFEITFTGG
jgi:hypothetical protein